MSFRVGASKASEAESPEHEPEEEMSPSEGAVANHGFPSLVSSGAASPSDSPEHDPDE
ncbi:MAG: hypothetical protein U0745_11190 [Polyangia bacterium]|jgi:hypothetical protein